ncbi:MAG: hypothetical protein E7655_05800 [Ruminococcaceae bacterium]|nr:hypothetical protein [Oscillospiraceae bacterium]
MSNRIDTCKAADRLGMGGGKIGMPLRFGIALAQDRRATDAFSALPDDRKKQVIEGARGLHSNEELRQYVSSIG